MEAYTREIEVQRVMNLVGGFGWEKVKEEIVGKDLVITVKKTILSESEVTGGPAPS